ncbi:MAG: hypothetical protein H7138_15210 [Myxococcales bacterium]|nr:hypothetical protein [Myxococcales bacterium]
MNSEVMAARKSLEAAIKQIPEAGLSAVVGGAIVIGPVIRPPIIFLPPTTRPPIVIP